MRTKLSATAIAGIIATALVWPGCRESITQPDNSLEAEYQKLVELNRERNKQIMSLEFDIKNLQAECMTYKSRLEECQTKADSLTVQLAESQKARQQASPQNCASLTTSQHAQPAVPSAVPQVEYYQPRRRLFGGRFR